jgi:hypothetical protein
MEDKRSPGRSPISTAAPKIKFRYYIGSSPASLIPCLSFSLLRLLLFVFYFTRQRSPIDEENGEGRTYKCVGPDVLEAKKCAVLAFDSHRDVIIYKWWRPH